MICDVSLSSGEIRNRLRGGGGGDGGSQKAVTRRPELERSLSKGVEESEKSSASHRQLYDGGLLDNLKTLMHALKGYYGKRLHDPITLVMLLHLILTLVHFIVWASSYGGVNGNGPIKVSSCTVLSSETKFLGLGVYEFMVI